MSGEVALMTAPIEILSHGCITNIRPAKDDAAECILNQGAPVIIPAFLAAYLGSGLACSGSGTSGGRPPNFHPRSASCCSRSFNPKFQ
jgi:hypothetical protein